MKSWLTTRSYQYRYTNESWLTDKHQPRIHNHPWLQLCFGWCHCFYCGLDSKGVWNNHYFPISSFLFVVEGDKKNKTFSKGNKATSSDKRRGKQYPGTFDPAKINHIQFILPIFCCCQPRSRSFVSCQQCLQFLPQGNVKTATLLSKVLWNAEVSYSVTTTPRIKTVFTGLSIC